MKFQKGSVDQNGDNVQISANWLNRFRKPAYVKLAISATPFGSQEDLLFAGDTKDAHGLLFGMAQLAWNMGWRPSGLLETTMECIRSYKIPGK